MPTLKEIKKRVGSARTVHKITKAMKLISASKSKAAAAANSTSKAYSTEIFSLVRNLWPITDHKLHPLLSKNNSLHKCYVIITTDKGLCGGLLDKMESYLEKENVFGGAHDTFILIGKKGINQIAKRGKTAQALFEIGLRKPTFEFTGPITSMIKKGYLDGKYGQVIVFYTSFVSSLRQEPAFRQILPAVALHELKFFKDTALFEPNPDTVLESLLPRYLEIQLFQLVLESVASEHAARMMAMDKATTSAEEIIDGLTLVYNKKRQENITRELLEITTTISAL